MVPPISDEEYALGRKFMEEWEKEQENAFVIRLPPKFTHIGAILGGRSITQYLKEWNDEDICAAMISQKFLSFAKDTPVEDTLKSLVQKIRTNCMQIENCSWRWKVKRCFMMNKNNVKSFMSECKVTKEQMYRCFKFLTRNLLPPDFLGDQNNEALIKWLTGYVFILDKDRYKQKYPRLASRRFAACRAMRCPQFRKAVEDCNIPFDVIQMRTTLVATAFAAKFILGASWFFLSRIVQFNAEKFTPDVIFYPRWGLKFWARKEREKFMQEYALERVALSEIPSDLYQVKMAGMRNNVRPLCILKERMNVWMIAEMKFLNNAMDYFIQLYKLPRYEEENIFKDVAWMDDTAKNKTQNLLVRNYLRWIRENHPKKRFYFMTCDVSQCFSTLKHDILKELLLKIIGDRHCVVGRFVYTNRLLPDKYHICYRNGSSIEDVKSKLKEYLSKCQNMTEKQIANVMKDATFRTFNRAMADEIMAHVKNLKFQIGSKFSSIFKMQKGVPQGHILSQRLSHIYLLNYDRDYILPMLNDGSMLFRYCDDYLFITNTKKAAQGILKVLSSENRYGIRFNKEKTKVSFRAPGFKRRTLMSWCGQKIDAGNYRMWNSTGKMLAKKYPSRFMERRRIYRNMNNQVSSIGLESSNGDSFGQFCLDR